MRMFAVILAVAAPAFILLTGEGNMHFVDNAMLPKNGWIALYDDPKASSLRPTDITVKADREMKTVEVDSTPPGAVLVMHGIPQLTGGSVKRAVWNRDESLLRTGDRIAFTLGRDRYTITLHASDTYLKDARVVLEKAGVSQTLFSHEGEGDEPHFEILWAGDLDRDGRLDLVMTMSPKYSYYPRTILLSSAAHPGELVHEVALWQDYSC